MAHSADLRRTVRAPRVRRARVLAGIAVLGVAGPLAGCTTTQQKAARLQLNSARLRAEQVPTKIKRQSTTVQATSISLLRQGKRTAFVVTVTNNSKKTVSDLPILVGYRGAGGGVFVNGAVGTDYFASHLPLIAAGASVRWVVTTTRDVPSTAHPLTEIGARPTVAATGLAAPPTVSAAASMGSGETCSTSRSTTTPA